MVKNELNLSLWQKITTFLKKFPYFPDLSEDSRRKEFMLYYNLINNAQVDR